MKAILLLALSSAAFASMAPTDAAHAQRRGDEREVFDQLRSGRILSLREIERRVTPTMAGAQYIGFDFDSDSGIYTLKFLRDGDVIRVAVDGRSGQVIGRTSR